MGLYPSISKEVATELYYEAVMETEVEAKNMNFMEATRFLALSMDECQVKESGLKQVLPKRSKTGKGV